LVIRRPPQVLLELQSLIGVLFQIAMCLKPDVISMLCDVIRLSESAGQPLR